MYLSSSLTENWTQRQCLQVILIQSVLNTHMMVYQDHSKP